MEDITGIVSEAMNQIDKEVEANAENNPAAQTDADSPETSSVSGAVENSESDNDPTGQTTGTDPGGRSSSTLTALDSTAGTASSAGGTDLGNQIKQLAEKVNTYEEEKQAQETSALKDQFTHAETATNQWFNDSVATLSNNKATMLAEKTQEYLQQGYNGGVLADLVSRYASHLDAAESHQLQQLTAVKQAELQRAAALRQRHDANTKQQAFKKIETELAQELQDPAIKHAFDEYKTKYTNADEFKNFVVPLLKEVFEIKGVSDAKTKQINKAKDQLRQKAVNTAGGAKPGSGTRPMTVDELLNLDDSKFTAFIHGG
jgi:hypothetical protein